MSFSPSALREARNRAGISQRELAARAGVGFRTVQRAEKREPIPSIQEALARALGLSLDDLLISHGEHCDTDGNGAGQTAPEHTEAASDSAESRALAAPCER